MAWTHYRQPVEARESEESPAVTGNGGRVSLSERKLAALSIRSEPAAPRALQPIHRVPGRVQYNETRHVAIRAAANGILVQIRVEPGDQVRAGQVLAIVSSPEIGTARADVHHSGEKLKLARKKREWESEISKNVASLIDGLKSRVPMNDLEKRFHAQTLGAYRDELMTAYSRFLLAEVLAKSADSLGAQVVSAKIVQERLAERRSAEAALSAACEQAGFDAKQRTREAEIEEGRALRAWNIAKEHLSALLTYEDPVSESVTSGDVLSHVEIRAPFAGTIEERHFARAERVRTSDTLLVLADTSSLWISAEIRDRDWPAVSLRQGQEVAVEAPALPRRRLKARVRYIGRQVVSETNSVPLMADISNADGLLRPGLFVWVSLPVGAERTVLCVPASAIVQHDDVKFVFVREGKNAFRRADVTLGMQTDDWAEIRGGISEGALVVVEGAMALKSELLVGALAKEE